ncbi:sure-like protein [Phellopilus nigrolimitatus]|nr:sure-like protein [Phellopilus nigrolimitatus]
MTSAFDRPRVLLTNDDGPPGKDSPYIFGFARYLATNLGWDVKVVIPSSQKSWIGKAYHIKEVTKGRYYYPRSPDGNGETSTFSRPLKVNEGEFAEWVLLDGTPATCANIALHNMYKGDIDLVISGPNYGRNSSAAFALSSGTIGAALSSSLSHCRSVALSYGTVQRPVPENLFDPAHALAGRIIQGLWGKWGADAGGMRNGEIDLYNVNIPMVDGLLNEKGIPVVWTTIWRNAYGRLFQAHMLDSRSADTQPAGGPDAQLSPQTGSTEIRSKQAGTPSDPLLTSTSAIHKASTPAGQDGHAPELVFKFAPDMSGLIGPRIGAPIGSDAWAIEHGWASVTPMRASFAEPPISDVESSESVDVADPVADEDEMHGVRLFKL